MKKTLLIAAAALVAGVVSSQAQVYSANIVGYVNYRCPASTLTLLSNPLDDGTNTANDLAGSHCPTSRLQIWNGTGFTLIQKPAGFAGNPSTARRDWFLCEVGSANYTNTFVGNVVPAPGGNTATNALPAGSLALVGSILPVSGNFNDVGTNAFNLNRHDCPTSRTVQIWNGIWFYPIHQDLVGFRGQSGLYSGPRFLYQGVSAANWVQTLQ